MQPLDAPRKEGAESSAPLFRPRALSMKALGKLGAFRYHTNLILHHLKEAAFDLEAALSAANPQRPFPQQGHHRRVPGQDSELAVEGRHHDRVSLSLE